jgi:hypothetical protein
MRITFLTIAVAASCLLSACRKPPEPEDVAAQFYQLCEVGRQEGFAEVQPELFALLSKPSQELLGRHAEQVNDKLALPDLLSANQCLILDELQGEKTPFSAERLLSGKERVRLRVKRGEAEAELELVLEEGGWRVEMGTAGQP